MTDSKEAQAIFFLYGEITSIEEKTHPFPVEMTIETTDYVSGTAIEIPITVKAINRDLYDSKVGDHVIIKIEKTKEG